MSKKLGFALSGIMLAMAAGTAFAANDMDGGQLNISGLLNVDGEKVTFWSGSSGTASKGDVLTDKMLSFDVNGK